MPEWIAFLMYWAAFQTVGWIAICLLHDFLERLHR